MSFPWLSILAGFPLIAGVVTFALKGQVAKIFGFVAATITAILAIVIAVANWANLAGLAEDHLWLNAIGAHYALSLDGMGVVMVLMTAILVPIVFGYEWYLGEEPTPEVSDTLSPKRWSAGSFFALALIMESLAIIVFLAADVLLFYLFFEATLIPMYFMIGGWGGANRNRAALKFLLYNLAGGLIMLFSVVGLGVLASGADTPSLRLDALATLTIDPGLARWLWLGFFVAFAIKAPMVPVHTWLPDAAEQSTPGTAALMAGVLDKIGTFGMLRICLTLFPEASLWATPVIEVLAVISILYGALLAIGSTNLLRFVAYTSVSHFGFMILGIFAATSQSITGAVFYMFNHGFSTVALFLAVGYLINRRGSAEIAAFGGVAQRTPLLAGMLFLAGLSALGLPGFSSFISEFMVLAGTWARFPWVSAVATLGMVLAAIYVLVMIKRVNTGPVTTEVEQHFGNDLRLREKTVIAPLILVMLVFGCYPKPVVEVIEPVANQVLTQMQLSDPDIIVKQPGR